MRSLLPILLASALAAQTPDVRELPMEARLSWQTLRMPSPAEPMGLMGLELLREHDHGFAWGLGGYGALTGDRGGFITMGLAGAWRPVLTDNLHLDLGAFCGGGGAGRAFVGGGWMVEGHAGLDWQAETWRLGAAYERIRFPNGDINTGQWRLSFARPFGLRRSGSPIALAFPDLGWRELEVAFTASRYRPEGGYRTDGTPERDVDLVGLQTALGLGDHAFATLELAGAHGGGADGYMEGLLGLGWRWGLDQGDRWRAHFRLAAGPAGGGRLDVGGGFAWKGALGLEARVGASTVLTAETGYLAAPGGGYRAITWQVGLGRRFGVAMPGGRPSAPSDTFADQPWRLEAGLAELTDPRRGDAPGGGPVRLASLRLALPLTPRFYLAGEAAFGTSGRAGGYAEGLLGVGVESAPLQGPGTSAFAELALGAGGGGGLETRGGALIQPVLGLHQPLADGLDLTFRVGRTRALHGGLDSPMVALGLRWRTSVLTRRPRP
ncbi:MAG TPA: hypothetical protein VJ623_03375 [Holophagaceae bacterium]|nr:hypothetical protein [Holophagaceae bacterium]